LDTLVTVVDGAQLLTHLASDTQLTDLDMEAGEGDTRSLAELLIDQIECCDVLMLNKVDLLTPSELERVRTLLHKLQPTAKYIETSFSNVPYTELVDTGLFSLEKAERSAGWIHELEHGHHAHTPETQEYNISSFVYRSNRPFDPQKLWKLIHTTWDGVVRAKGFLWLASRPDAALIYSQAGQQIRIEA
jgi:G3E family GTPase